MTGPWGADLAGGEPAQDGSALDLARSFVRAVAWGEHKKVWDLLGTDGRKTVLRIASGRGMNEVMAGRIRDGTATPGQMDEFLSDLVNGLRADLATTDLDAVGFRDDPAPGDGTPVWVVLTAPMPAALGGDVPVATIEVEKEEGRWVVSRITATRQLP
ncbi:MAG: hypothetical protein ACRDYC_09545 [Acidimicrobiales bacterium]